MSEADSGTRQDERLVYSLLRQGDVVGALDGATRVPAGQRTLELEVLAAEARTCLGHGRLDDIEDLRDRARAAGDGELALRVEATLADHYATRGDETCGLVATQALADVSELPLRSAPHLWARGRLWRTLALATLFLPEDRPARSLSLLERAKADFSRAGFDAEWVRSAADLHFIWTLAFDEDYDQSRDTIDECLARLRHHGSSYVDLVLAYRAYLDLVTGDLAATHVHAAEVERIGETRRLHPFALVTVSYIRVAIALIAHGPDAAVLQAVDDHLATVRSEALPLTAGQLVGLASILVDLGHDRPGDLALARRWAAQAGAGQASTPRTTSDLAALRARIDLLETGSRAAVEAIDADLEEGRRLGLHRDVAHRALRAALAARRAGRDEDAERLHLEGLASLPPPVRRTLWEHALASVAGSGRTAGSPTVLVRLLGPAAQVHVGPDRLMPSAATARLLVALVAEGGAAPADRLIDALWPDADPVTGRRRLRVALHRLRRALRGGEPADPLGRRGDLVMLAPGVAVDTMEFEKLATGSADDRRVALELYGGAVAHAQLAYDDVAAPLRRRLDALWRDLAREALADPALPRAARLQIARVAAADAPSDPELAEILRMAEQRPADGSSHRPPV